MSNEHSTHYATVRIELEDVTAETARKFWSSLYGHEVEIAGYIAVVVQVEPEDVSR